MALAHELFWEHLGICKKALGIEMCEQQEQIEALLHLMKCGGTPCRQACKILLACLDMNKKTFRKCLRGEEQEHFLRHIVALGIRLIQFGVRGGS